MHRFALKCRQIDSNDIEFDNEINRSTKIFKSRNETITLNQSNPIAHFQLGIQKNPIIYQLTRCQIVRSEMCAQSIDA